MESSQPAVMGPAHFSPINLLEPPRLELTTDKYLWRQSVRIWAKRILDYAEGGENRAKGVANTFFLTIYSCMNYGYQQLVNRSVDAGEIFLRSNSNTPNEQRIEALEKIICLVAKDSVSDSVRRKVKMIRTIHNCIREDNENFTRYADRFYGHAQAYLNLSGSTDNGKDSQTLAMVLLENSKLSTVTFNNVVSSLIAAARVNPVISDTYHQITASKLHKLKRILTNILNLDKHGSEKDSSVVQEATSDKSNVAEVKECHETINNILNPHKFVMTEKSERSFIRLEDALAAIKDLQVDNPPDKKATADTECGIKITKTMIAGKGFNSSGFNHKRTSFRKKGNCWACDKPDHQWKDRKCEMHPLNRKRPNSGREDQPWSRKHKADDAQDTAEKEEESKPEDRQYFQ